MNKVEILAPAGSMEGLKAAVAFGADAVYLGGLKHNARINARNFDGEDIKTAIKYARLRGKRVYITLNTLLFDDEFEELAKYADELFEMGACAVILQDLGAAKVIAENCTIPIHASTQMGIHNLDGCKFIERLGFERAILSRETPLDEIRHIRANSDIELETFVHGALCGCFSGQCYYSFLKGGRSGNRGECAQPCRLEQKGYGHPLSTKDLMALELIPQLIAAGITSFKIEGRMKRPAYAGIVTDIYRRAVDLAMDNREIPVEKYREELIKIYNRGGFTKGYYMDNKDIFGSGRPNHMGEKVGVVTAVKKNRLEICTDKEIHLYDGLSFGKEGMEISDLYENGVRKEQGRGNLSFSCVLRGIKKGDTVYRTTDRRQIEAVERKTENDKLEILLEMECEVSDTVKLKLSAMGKTAEVHSYMVEQAKTRGITEEDVIKCLSKLGDTDFALKAVSVKVQEGVFVAVSEMNALRRKGVALLETELIKAKGRDRITVDTGELVTKYEGKRICIGISKKERRENCDIFLVYPARLEEDWAGADGIVLPPISFEEDLQAVEQVISSGDILVCNNVSQLERFKGKCRLWAGMGMNCTNSKTAEFLAGIGCEAVIGSVERIVPNTLKIKKGVIPAMTFVSCPKKRAVGCEKCKRESIIGGKRQDFTCVTLKNRYAFLLYEYKGDFGQVEFI